jgi:hypothetical protein
LRQWSERAHAQGLPEAVTATSPAMQPPLAPREGQGISRWHQPVVTLNAVRFVQFIEAHYNKLGHGSPLRGAPSRSKSLRHNSLAIWSGPP